MKWLVPIFLTGCAAAVLDEPGELYECRLVPPFLICAPERAVA